MPNKSVVLTIMATALLFGVVSSGCNRNRNDQVAVASARRHTGQRRDTDRSVRPAEVLSVSVRRSRPQGRRGVEAVAHTSPPRHQSQPQYAYSHSAPAAGYAEHVYVQSGNLAQYEPLPEPIPIPNGSVYQPRSLSGYDAAAEPAPAYAAYSPPELALARAAMEPMPIPSAPASQSHQQPIPVVVPPVRSDPPLQAPIPELEPTLYRRVSAPIPGIAAAPAPATARARPASPRLDEHDDLQRALSPLSRRSSPSQDWVASPLTAMRPVNIF